MDYFGQHMPSRRWVSLLIAAALACGGSSDAPTAKPVEPTPTPEPPRLAPVLVLSRDSIAVAALSGADPVAEDIQITAGNTTPLSGVSAGVPSYEGGEGWLNATITTSGSSARVMVDPRALAAGRYTARFLVMAAGATPRTVRVDLTVRARPVLVVEPASVAFEALLGDSASSGSVTIKSTSDTIGKLGVTTPDCGGRDPVWLAATLSATTTPAQLRLRANPLGLGVGSYTCRIAVTTSQPLVDSASRTVATQLSVRQAPAIVTSPSLVEVSLTAGQLGAATVVAISNGGSGTLDGLSLGAIDYGTGPTGWIVRGVLTAATAPAALQITPTAERLTPGTYAAIIPVLSTASGITNSPQLVRVSLRVVSPPARLTITPSAISMSCRANTVPFMGSYFVAMSDGSRSTLTGVTLPSETILPGTAIIRGEPNDSNIPRTVQLQAICGSTTGTYRVTLTYTESHGTNASVILSLTVTP
jgi:hypothetical protein